MIFSKFHTLAGKQGKIAWQACLLCVLFAFFLVSCKTSRKASSSSTAKTDRINVTFDANEGVASSSATTSKAPATSVNTAVTSSNRYPATEYYGNHWNTQHVRLNADPKPTGTTQLTLLVKNGTFVMPVCGKVLSEFGPRNGRMHTGIDLKLEMNEPVHCVFDGMVRMAKTYGDYGKMVVVRHDNGLETLYGHLNSIAVKEGQYIRAGTYIGGGGRTGRATGVHLHFETRFQGEPFNPRLAVDFDHCQLTTENLALNSDSYKLYYKNLQLAESKPTPKTSPELTEQATTPVITLQHTEHVVEKGDTLYNISRRYGTTVDSLRRLNQLTESSVLKIGQKLVVVEVSE